MSSGPNGAPAPVTAAGNALAGVANAATNAFQNVKEGVTNAVNAAAKNVNKATNAVANSVAKNVPAINSLIPFGSPAPAAASGANNSKKNAGANAGGLLGSVFGAGNNAKKGEGGNEGGLLGSVFGAGNNSKKNAGAEATAAPTNISPPATFANFSVTKSAGDMLGGGLGIFVGLIVVFLVIFAVFNEQIRRGYEYAIIAIKQALGLEVRPPAVASQITPSQGQIQELTVPPSPPQTMTPDQEYASQSLVEKVLPTTGAGAEVFNVAQNDFTFYDAEPLCKALGAELATYEQVKTAWNRGADWCNYGWVKGQMAIYPTQKDTYDKLQAGPADEKLACGTVGLNGGFFDNPELRFGVNCYGKKPSQTAHDEKMLMEEGKVPRSPATLKVDQLVAQFKDQADSLFVKPFSDDKWSSA